MRRRSFLAAALAGIATGVGAGLTGCGVGSVRPEGRGFATQLQVPPLLQPPVDASGVRRFALTLQRGSSALIPGNPTETWGINGSYLGPTLRARRGDHVAMAVTNRTGEVTTLHWHGMRLPAAMDGGPHQAIVPDATWTPEWTVGQPSTTCWYHPHPHGTTAKHVYRGLAGMFILDDAADQALGLPADYGVDDIPLILQDKLFAGDGSMIEALDGTFGLIGDTVLVNGTFDPHLQVRTERVRFRLLNASNARVYYLEFADHRTFQVIGTDGGLLPAPATADRVVLSPGERNRDGAARLRLEVATAWPAVAQGTAYHYLSTTRLSTGGDYGLLRWRSL